MRRCLNCKGELPVSGCFGCSAPFGARVLCTEYDLSYDGSKKLNEYIRHYAHDSKCVLVRFLVAKKWSEVDDGLQKQFSASEAVKASEVRGGGK